MSAGLKIYDSKEVTVVIAGILVDGGYAEGEFVSVDQDSNDFEDVVGTDGEVARSKTNDRRGTVTLRLMQTATVNAALSALNKADLLAPNGAGVGALLIKDRQGTSLYTASKCWIAKPPKASFDKTATAREWVIRCADLVRLDGGN